MQAGTLRHRMTIERATETQNEYGEVVFVWSTLASVWGAFEPLRGRERFEAQHHAIEEDTRIRIRHRSDVTAEDRVSTPYGTFAIQAVLNVDGRDRELHLQCQRKQ
jgi:SPP1 family predicted phage head-tail adaptor